MEWEYLCELDFVDIVIFNRGNRILLNRRIALSETAMSKMKEVREILLRTKGKEISKAEILTALQKYQSTIDLDDVERMYFQP